MEGISGLGEAMTALSTAETSSVIGVKALKMALEQAEDAIQPLVEGLGETIDLIG